MRFLFLLSSLLVFLPQSHAKMTFQATPIALAQCNTLVHELYRGRLPYTQLSDVVVREKVECTVGFTKPSQVVHHEHVQARYSAQEQQEMRTSMSLKGRKNPMVKKLCEQSSYAQLLEFVDLAYRFYLDGLAIGEVRVSADMCTSL